MGSRRGKERRQWRCRTTRSPGRGKVTVFLLHGIYGSKEYWRPQTERLVARGYRVVAWDAPGYGLSPLPDPFTFDVVAEAGAQLVRALGSERNVFHGHSMGGQITPRIRLKVAGAGARHRDLVDHRLLRQPHPGRTAGVRPQAHGAASSRHRSGDGQHDGRRLDARPGLQRARGRSRAPLGVAHAAGDREGGGQGGADLARGRRRSRGSRR